MKLILKIAGAIIGIILIGFVLIQFIPVDRTNPPVAQEPNWDSPQTRTLAERACFDCHSNETKWPWYSKVAPISWLVAHDVEEGRAALNLSEWGGRPAGEQGEGGGEGAEYGEAEEREGGEGGEGMEVGEIAEVIAEGEMPLWQYLLIHPEARLSQAETKALITGLQATFGQSAQTEEEGINQAQN
jgi:hypothetical protein